MTHILVAAAQATHGLVPPDAIEPLVMALANNFVSDHNSAEAMTVGLNAIREIVARCPLAMTDTLLQDLAQYKSHRDKGVMNAARSLIGLFRDVNPEMLRKKDRGKAAASAASDESAPTPIGKRLYGAVPVADHVDGAEVRARGIIAWAFSRGSRRAAAALVVQVLIHRAAAPSTDDGEEARRGRQ